MAHELKKLEIISTYLKLRKYNSLIILEELNQKNSLLEQQISVLESRKNDLEQLQSSSSRIFELKLLETKLNSIKTKQNNKFLNEVALEQSCQQFKKDSLENNLKKYQKSIRRRRNMENSAREIFALEDLFKKP